MKIQSLAVVFALIILPIIITLSYYIHREVDTITLQTSYDTKLIDATHDAMASFELNTANEDLSGVSDALRSIIQASNNVFFNSLATNLGMSNANKDYVQPYIPAILYTLYDGYYIYSPTRVPEVLVGKNSSDQDELVHIGDTGVEYTGMREKTGIYTFNSAEFDPTNKKTYSLPNSIQYEYGQMLYKNDDNTYSPKINSHTYYKQDYMLKSYMPYSARYRRTASQGSAYDLTINYTLDNYITIMGYIGNVYYSKTGYLIKSGTVSNFDIDDSQYVNIFEENEFDAEKVILSGKNHMSLTIKPTLENGLESNEITYNYDVYSIEDEEGNIVPLSYSEQKERLTKLYEDIENYYNIYRTSSDSVEKETALQNIRIINSECQNLEFNMENLSSIAYYIKAQIFSNWVYDNLGRNGIRLVESNLQDDLYRDNNQFESELSHGATAFHHSFANSNRLIFNENEDPENPTSIFASHRYNVIRNSIQYNLNLAISVYDEMVGEKDIKMPVISDIEWEKILKNVSIVSFMQGLNCGLKYYNNYAIVSSTNNELAVIPDEIYYVKKDLYNTGDMNDVDNPIYHRIDCESLENTDDLISFKSKEIKYDKIYDKNSGRYKYDHKNLACYNCIVNSNYLKRVSDTAQGYSEGVIPSALTMERRKAYYRAIGKARQTTYKTNALTDSSGYEVVFSPKTLISLSGSSINIGFTRTSAKEFTKIKAIEITVKNVKTDSFNNSVVMLEPQDSDGWAFSEPIALNLQETPQTITIPNYLHSPDHINSIILDVIDSMATTVSFDILNVRIIYK